MSKVVRTVYWGNDDQGRLIRKHIELSPWIMALIAHHEKKIPDSSFNFSKFAVRAVEGYLLDNGFISPPREATIIAKSAGVPVSSLMHSGRIVLDLGVTYKALARFSNSIGESMAGEIIHIVRTTLERMYLADLSEIVANAIDSVEDEKEDIEESEETDGLVKA